MAQKCSTNFTPQKDPKDSSCSMTLRCQTPNHLLKSIHKAFNLLGGGRHFSDVFAKHQTP